VSVLVDDRWIGDTGIGRFTREVLDRLVGWRPAGCPLRIFHPLEPAWFAARLALARKDTFFTPAFNAPPISFGPTVITLYDLNHVRMDPVRFKWRAYYQMIVRPAARRAFAVVTVSEYSRRDILEWSGLPPERVVVVGAGVGEAFHAGADRHHNQRPYLVCVTSLFEFKNVPRLLRAFGASRAAREIDLVIVTSSPNTPELAALAAHVAPGHVHFTGGVDDARLAGLYRGAVACIQPSLFEGFGLPVVEAMACGTPVAHSERTALAEVAGGAGLPFDPVDETAITAAIDTIAFDSTLRAELAARGFARATAFRWDAVAARVSDVLARASSA
jgi:glycosyltransferase involved in cell wall biosynthesis